MHSVCCILYVIRYKQALPLMMISALKSLWLCFCSSYSGSLFLIDIFQFRIWNQACIVDNTLPFLDFFDFSLIYPLLFIFTLNYTSNRIDFFYNKTKFQPINHPTLLKFLHNTSVKRL